MGLASRLVLLRCRWCLYDRGILLIKLILQQHHLQLIRWMFRDAAVLQIQAKTQLISSGIFGKETLIGQCHNYSFWNSFHSGTVQRFGLMITQVKKLWYFYNIGYYRRFVVAQIQTQ
jgi:hypothetical protein